MARWIRSDWKIVAGILFFALLGYNAVLGHRRFERCILCRVVHIRHDPLGFHWETFQNACSQWFQSFTGQPHEHLWDRSVDPYSEQNLFGATIGIGSNISNRPAQLLTPEQQIEVYQHIGDVKESTDLFIELRNCVLKDHQNGSMIAGRLKSWAEDDKFKTPWPEWRVQMAKDLIERPRG